ncbi:hypothetical protein [Hydrogenophaga sp. H7]|uniref:hypothetical protein n=1 Tax=Hydrogenophaga sp. H7 TaxID=1882399 RepID=UPI0009A3CAE8|nr:hypothetical protein [Hydrogenophaga sp. H7]OPF63631.1 hypothetical protein BC358_06805 [Hydrogenophaga sp. H7]
MSNTQFAFIEKSEVPGQEALQSAIDELGFDLRVSPKFAPFKDSGFVPFTLKGETGPGFEIFYEDAAEISGADAALKTLAGGKDYCISMIWGGSMKDLACVLIVSCALAKAFGAVVSYEGEAPMPLPALIEATETILKLVASEA